MVVHMHQCEECATCTSDPPNKYGNYYCNKHKPALSYGMPETTPLDIIEFAA